MGWGNEAPCPVPLTWGKPLGAISQTPRESRQGRGLTRRKGQLRWIWTPPLEGGTSWSNSKEAGKKGSC